MSARPRSAFTLVETVISVAIVALVVLSAMTTFGATARIRRVQADGQHARGLANQLLSEIVQAAYEDPETTGGFGPEPDERAAVREDWDDVDDYDDWSATPPEDKYGNELTDYAGWSRSATVVPTDSGAAGGDFATLTDLRQVTVVVTDPAGRSTEVTSLVSATGAGDWPSPAPTDVTSWIGIELQTGAAQTGRLRSGVTLFNGPPATTAAPNMLANPGVESGLTAWKAYSGCFLSDSTSNPHRGDSCVKASSRSSQYSGPGQDITAFLENGATYEVSFWGRKSSGADRFEIAVYVEGSLSGGVWHAAGGKDIGTSWTKMSGTFTPTWSGALVTAFVKVRTTSSTGRIYVDDAYMRMVP